VPHDYATPTKYAGENFFVNEGEEARKNRDKVRVWDNFWPNSA
jgi:hypothetical protein